MKISLNFVEYAQGKMIILADLTIEIDDIVYFSLI